MGKLIRKYLSKAFVISLLGLAVLLWSKSVTDLKVYFWDVGQGDSELIITPNQQTVLIDGGPAFGLVAKLDSVLPNSNRQLDLMVLTHPHDDHLIGLLEVLKVYKVKEVLITGVPAKTKSFQEFQKLITAKKIKTTIARAGQTWEFGGVEDFSQSSSSQPIRNNSPPILTVLYPLTNVSQQKFDDLNASSIVLKLAYGQSIALFMGDLPSQQEEEILASNQTVKAQVLKVGHHGSSYSSAIKFLQAVKPVWSIISCGLHNLFHHPSPSTLAKLQAIKSQILITKDVGTVILKTNSSGIWTNK